MIRIVDYTIDEVNPDDFAALAIPGGFEEYGFYNHVFAEPFLNLIRSFHQQDKLIASICTGAFPIAKSGVLEGKKGFNGVCLEAGLISTENLCQSIPVEFGRNLVYFLFT